MTISDENEVEPSSAQEAGSTPVIQTAGFRRSKLWSAIFLLHGIAALTLWWLLAGGFPAWHVRFWTNQVLPLVFLSAAILGVIGVCLKSPALIRAIAWAVVGYWTALLASASVIFPSSAPKFWIPGAIVLLFVWGAAIKRRPPAARRQLPLACGLIAVAVGIFVPWSQRGEDPATHPMQSSLPPTSPNQPFGDRTLQLSPTVAVDAIRGDVVAQIDPLSIEIEPLLTFHSRSPDRCWTIFALEKDRGLGRRILTLTDREGGTVLFRAQDVAEHVLEVRADDNSSGCLIETFSRLDNPVFSHLNTFCRLDISGHSRLSLVFSPCPQVHVTVEPAGYPAGLPWRLAYLDEHELFHVVEAFRGEKGPFRNLASGELRRTEPLVISIYDAGRAIAKITLADWAAQCSTQLSPTAGWRLPVNAISFCRLGDASDDPAAIWVTLADTAVGRGWDSVGHRAGVYRNRIRVEPAGITPD